VPQIRPLADNADSRYSFTYLLTDLLTYLLIYDPENDCAAGEKESEETETD